MSALKLIEQLINQIDNTMTEEKSDKSSLYDAKKDAVSEAKYDLPKDAGFLYLISIINEKITYK